MAEIRDENGRKERHYLFFDGESVNGKVRCTVFNKCTFRTGKDNMVIFQELLKKIFIIIFDV